MLGVRGRCRNCPEAADPTGDRRPSEPIHASCAPGIEIGEDFTVCLEVDDSTPSVCEVYIQTEGLVCSTRRTRVSREQHRLLLGTGTHVEVNSGNWDIQSAPRSAIDKLTLTVDNRRESLRISSRLGVDSLVSIGTHEFDLFTRGRASIVVRQGTATFRGPLRFVEVVGDGSVRALSGTVDSHFNMIGSVDVHDAIENTDFYIAGDLEALGPVNMGERVMQCGNAVLRSGLSTAGLVECRSLEVEGPLESTGDLKLGSLRCAGTLRASQIEVLGEITIAGHTPGVPSNGPPQQPPS